MKLGLYLRNMGPQSTRPLIAAAARAAGKLHRRSLGRRSSRSPAGGIRRIGRALRRGAGDAGVPRRDHRASVPGGGRARPYRPALLTAKWVASIQELSAGRLILGVGVGWMEKEFLALGADPEPWRDHRRNACLSARCFAADEVEANGQAFLFRPRPPRPPIIVGGAPPHAIRRAVRFGDGWMPTGAHGKMLDAGIASLREGMAAAGKPTPEVVLLQPLPVEDDERLAARLRELAALGITRVVHPWRYRDAEEVARIAARLVAARDVNAPAA